MGTDSEGNLFKIVWISLNSFSTRSTGTHPRSQANDLRASSVRFFSNNQCGLSGTKKSAVIDISGNSADIAAIVLHFKNVPSKNWEMNRRNNQIAKSESDHIIKIPE